MSLIDSIQAWQAGDLDGQLAAITAGDVQRALTRNTLTERDYLALLSPAATPFLEQMAQQAHRMTVAQFGRTMVLYTPLYLSNYCTNRCVYCGFNQENKIGRHQLTLAQVKAEGKAIAATGLKHILILTGDAPAKASVDYIESCCAVLRGIFPAIGMEIYALTEAEYARLIQAGVESLTLYQETYNPVLYAELHPKGPKRDYHFRLDAPERAAAAGMRAINVGALLGLDDWRHDAFYTGLHAGYLQARYPDVEVSVSLPRMRPHAGGFQPRCVVTDRDLVQILTALRLFMPRAGITISTRESAAFRDRLVPLGVTRMSAGSCTTVGGRAEESEQVGQFDISDERSVPEMAAMLEKAGWQPVYKDWQNLGG